MKGRALLVAVLVLLEKTALGSKASNTPDSSVVKLDADSFDVNLQKNHHFVM